MTLIRTAGAKLGLHFSVSVGRLLNSVWLPVAALVTISGDGKFVRCWNPNDGVLLWETTTYSSAEGRASAAVDFALLSVSACYCKLLVKVLVLNSIWLSFQPSALDIATGA